MRSVFGILLLAVVIQSKLHEFIRLKRGIDAETIVLICARRPSLPYCQAANDRRRFPEVASVVGKSPLAFGKSTGNDAKFEIPGIGTLGLGQVNTDIAKFIPAGASGTANGGRFDLDGHKLEYMDSESATGAVKGKRGHLHIAGIGTFDVSKQAERGTGFSQIFEQLLPFHGSDDNIGREFEATPDPLSQQNFPEFRGNSHVGATSSPLVYNLIPSHGTTSTPSESSTLHPTLISTDVQNRGRKVVHAAKTVVDDSDFPPKSNRTELHEGFIEQESKEPPNERPLPLNPVQVQRTVSLKDLGLSKEEISKICAKFTVQAAKHCYGTQIEKEYIDRCRGYMSDCTDYISDRKPLGAIANAFSSSVGVTYYNWGVNGIPYYAINDEGGISNGHNGKADFGSWGGGYSENVGVRDFWTQTGEFGGNWYEGTYGHKTGWRVPIAQQFGIEGGQGSQVYIPVKEGDFGKPLGFSRGFFVGPYVGTAEKVGVDWLNGAVSQSQGIALPIVGVNANAGSSIAFPSLGSIMNNMGLQMTPETMATFFE
uniref:Peptidase S1 domain-containing protein n=1 Tax=Steinernema glaseri TaxID=37863 RepID=A0A1I8AQA6_9BILA